MKIPKITKAMYYIDDGLIEGAIQENRSKKKNVWAKWGVIAACLCLTVLAIPFAFKKVIPNRAQDPSNEHLNVQTDFIIENGVLMKYTGNSTDVTIPDEVVLISDTAFAERDKIVKLTIGKNTSEIAHSAFSSLKQLETIRVDTDNKYYKSTGHILVSEQGNLAFASIGAWKEEQFDYITVEVIAEMTKNGYSVDNMRELVIGPATIGINATSVEGTVYPHAVYVNVYGKTVNFSKPIQLVLNGKFQAFEASDCFVISSISYGEGDTYIITKSGQGKTVTSPMKNDPDKYYNDTMVSFFENNGVLCYLKQPRKYYKYTHQVKGGYMQYCTSIEDVFEEEGLAVIKDGEIHYQAEKITYLKEAIDIQTEFEDWKKTINLSNEMTLDDWLRENSKRYE